MDDLFNPSGKKPAIIYAYAADTVASRLSGYIGKDRKRPERPPGTKQDWLTPAPVIEPVLSALGLKHFDMDPCSPGAGRSNVPALRHVVEDPLDPEGGGLRAAWTGEAVWLNPPYCKPLPWTLKALEAVTAKQVGIPAGSRQLYRQRPGVRQHMAAAAVPGHRAGLSVRCWWQVGHAFARWAWKLSANSDLDGLSLKAGFLLRLGWVGLRRRQARPGFPGMWGWWTRSV